MDCRLLSGIAERRKTRLLNFLESYCFACRLLALKPMLLQTAGRAIPFKDCSARSSLTNENNPLQPRILKIITQFSIELFFLVQFRELCKLSAHLLPEFCVKLPYNFQVKSKSYIYLLQNAVFFRKKAGIPFLEYRLGDNTPPFLRLVTLYLQHTAEWPALIRRRRRSFHLLYKTHPLLK